MIKIDVDTKAVLAMLNGVSRQLPYTISLGLNRAAQHVKEAEQAEMRRVIDRPTQYTMNSLKITPSTKQNLTASVWFKEPAGRQNHYLLPMVDGGPRKMKAWERSMGGKWIVPTRNTKLDQYGNFGRGQINRLRALYGQQTISGSSQLTTSAAKARQFFRVNSQKGGLRPGIYERVQGGEVAGRVGRYMASRALISKQRGFMGPIQGGRSTLSDLNRRTKAMYPRGIKRIAAFVDQPKSYARRFDFYGVAKRTLDKVLMLNMRAAAEQALDTAKAYQPRLF